MDTDDEQNAQGGSSQIFCMRWVKRNAAKPVPDKIQLSKDELQQVIEEGRFVPILKHLNQILLAIYLKLNCCWQH